MGCTKIIYDLLPEKLFMGYGEEQLSRTLTFDISQMQAELPGGVPMIAYMRPRDELGYLASGVTLDGSTLTWELSAHVMQYKGIGGAQIVLVDESGEETHILKSHVMQMLIGSSIPLTGGEPPEPWETWLEQILAAAARAESAAADAEVQADRAETAEAGAQQALIDAGSPVIYGRAQTLTDVQQQTARGNIAAASAADVSDLKSAYDNLTYTEYNYFNPQDAIEGIRYDGSTGSAITAVESSAFAGIIFNVEYNKTYVVSRTDYFWIELDENNIILGFHSNANPHEFLAITPNKTGVKKVALSWRKSYVPIDNYMILDPNVSFNTYIKYPSETFIYKDVLNASGAETKEIYTVGSNGDFTSFTDMLVGLKDNSNPKVVYVNGGTYDIFAEMGGQEYIESISVDDAWSSVNHFVPPNTKIIGLGEVILTYLPTQTQMVSEDIAWKMSPLNIAHSCHIENITVKATNCRYAIHIERVDGESDKADITLKNVKAEWITGSSAHQAVGTGIGYNAHWLFEECIFKTDSTYPVFSVHTNAPDEHCGATITLRNCVLISSHANAKTVKMVQFISQYLPFAITNFVKIANCYTNGKIATDITNANTLKRQSFSVDVIGGSSYGLVDSQDQTSGYLINNYGSELLS